MVIEGEVNAHTEAIYKGKISCHHKACPKCDGSPGSFKLHERKPRFFLFIVDRLVRKTLSFLLRWKCPLCNQTFTQYPDFALPFKRYVKEEVLERSRRYVEEEKVSYKSGVEVQGRAIFYEGQEERIDDRSLSPSTLWRWVGFAGAMKRTLQKCLQLIRQKAPGCGIFREPLPLPPHKYRSRPRKHILQTCLRLFRAEEQFQILFGASIFLHFATTLSFP